MSSSKTPSSWFLDSMNSWFDSMNSQCIKASLFRNVMFQTDCSQIHSFGNGRHISGVSSSEVSDYDQTGL